MEIEFSLRVVQVQKEQPQAQSDRAAEIRRFCTSRGIDVLVHFTRLENLDSIFRHGLVSRHHLVEHKLASIINDDVRLDRCPTAVCLSIGFPNYKMFYRYRMNSPDSQWVVLLLDPSLLWELDCAFCLENAASRKVASISISARQSPKCLEAMFHDYSSVQRIGLGIPDNYPTHPQAEVLVMDRIEAARITQVHFSDPQAAEVWLKANPGCRQLVKVDARYFRPRCDYAAWTLQQSELREDQMQIVDPFDDSTPPFRI